MLGSAVDTLSGRPSPAGARILEALGGFEKSGEIPVLPERLLTAAQASSGALKTLVDKGAVVVREIPIRRAPHATPSSLTAAPTLTSGQRKAADWLAESIASREARTALLFGVTASGKTEVYLDAIGKTLQSGRTAIVLVPEIALTAQVVEIFTGRFGDEVAVLHSRLSGGERFDEWRRLQQGKARIAVGGALSGIRPGREHRPHRGG